MVNKKNESKSSNVLAVIAKEVNGKSNKKNELVVAKKKEVVVEDEEDVFVDAISFTDKLSVEEILRAKIERQEKIRSSKKEGKKAPTDEKYTSAMMQQRIKQHEGIDVRRETKIKVKDHKWVALALLIFVLIAVIAIGALLIFKIIEF